MIFSVGATRVGAFLLFVVSGCLGATQARAADNDVYGSWTVSRILPAGNVAALTEAQAKALIGRIVKYDSADMNNGIDHFRVKEYHRRTMTDEEFLTENKVAPRKLNLTGRRIIEISVEGKDRDIADQFGTGIYPLDKNRLVVVYGGVAFELRRTTAVK